MRRPAALQSTPWTQRPAEPHLRAKQMTIPAPMRGWVQNENIVASSQDGAQEIENWFPTTQGVRVRLGARLHATLPAAVVSMINYAAPTPKMFAATAAGLYDVTAPASATVAPAPIANLTSGYFSAQQITTAGGSFLVAVNGEDIGLIYDGESWNALAETEQFQVSYEGLATAFQAGETVTNGSFVALILAVLPETATTGTLILGPISPVSAFTGEFTAEFY